MTSLPSTFVPSTSTPAPSAWSFIGWLCDRSVTSFDLTQWRRDECVQLAALLPFPLCPIIALAAMLRLAIEAMARCASSQAIPQRPSLPKGTKKFILCNCCACVLYGIVIFAVHFDGLDGPYEQKATAAVTPVSVYSSIAFSFVYLVSAVVAVVEPKLLGMLHAAWVLQLAGSSVVLAAKILLKELGSILALTLAVMAQLALCGQAVSQRIKACKARSRDQLGRVQQQRATSQPSGGSQVPATLAPPHMSIAYPVTSLSASLQPAEIFQGVPTDINRSATEPPLEQAIPVEVLPEVEMVEVGIDRQTSDRSLCKICLDAPIDMLLMPCRHLCCCQDCASKLNECPICRAVISDRISVYRP